MATEVHQYTVSIPAGTQMDNLYSAAVGIDNREIETVDLEVPPGPAGLMGFYLGRAGTPVLPFEWDEFFVWDDREKSWQFDDLPTAQGWAVYGYNLDAYNNHEVVVRFHTNPTSTAQIVTPTITYISSTDQTETVTL